MKKSEKLKKVLKTKFPEPVFQEDELAPIVKDKKSLEADLAAKGLTMDDYERAKALDMHKNYDLDQQEAFKKVQKKKKTLVEILSGK